MRAPSSWVVSAAVFASLAAGASPAGATVIVVQPSSQDAYVSKDRPNRIAGANPTNTRIRVLASPPNTQVRRGLVQFSLAGIPAGSVVNSAIAELNAGNNAGNATLTHGLHRILAPWLQSAVKWNNQPPITVVATTTALVGSGRGFKSFTVTPDVQAAVNLCAADHGWMIKDQAETATNDAVNYIALEEPHPADLENRPRLTVDFTPPPCTTDADCADTNFCTTNEHCEGGVCVVTPVNCDDGNPCTDDICDCGSGCINANICNDGFSCTVDTCDPDTLACTNTKVDAVCGTECATGTCIADPDSTTVDPVTGCVPSTVTPSGTPCDDADACTESSACDGAGSCVGADPVECTPPGQCHEPGVCDPETGVCSSLPKSTGQPCDDDDACTQIDGCDGAGTCVGGDPVQCTALSQCHDAGTCDPETGQCSNPPKGSSESCNDGDACTQIDACDGAGTCVGADPVICAPLDQCHLAGTCDSGTGVCDDPVAPNGTGCDDANTCTIDDACLGGSCLGNPTTCGDGVVQTSCAEECDVPSGDPNCTPQCRFVCGPAPTTGCRSPALPGKATLLLKDKTLDKRDVLLWKWLKGATTALGEFGDPFVDTVYTLCVYDASDAPQPLIFSQAPAGGTCGTKPCWKAVRNGFKYNDRLLDPDGLQQVQLRAGAAPNAKIIVKGRGALLAMPTLPLTAPVTVQLKNDIGVCWEARYSTPIKNLVDQFKAKAD